MSQVCTGRSIEAAKSEKPGAIPEATNVIKKFIVRRFQTCD
jgi:hypothetical protein